MIVINELVLGEIILIISLSEPKLPFGHWCTNFSSSEKYSFMDVRAIRADSLIVAPDFKQPLAALRACKAFNSWARDSFMLSSMILAR